MSAIGTSVAKALTAIQHFRDKIQGDISARVAASSLGANVATLVNGKVPVEQLPSFVSDVIEYHGTALFPLVGEGSKIYVDIDGDGEPTYRWTGTRYLRVNDHVSVSDAAYKLATPRTISASGDATWSVTFDGTANATAVITLKDRGITAKEYGMVSLDAKGMATSARAMVANDITTALGFTPLANTDKAVNAANADYATTAGNASTAGTAITASSANIAGALATGRKISIIGDADWNVTFTGAADVTATLTLKSTGITAGTYSNITVNGKGLITGIAALSATDIITALGFTPLANNGKATSATTADTANALATGNNYQMNSLGVGTTASGTAGEIRATGNITGYYSDRRLKDVVSYIINPLDRARKLTPVIYKENELARSFGFSNARLQVGLMAQDVQEVQPEAVYPAPFDVATTEEGVEYSRSGENYLTVKYESLVPLLFGCIQELEKKVIHLQSLEERVEQLESVLNGTFKNR